MLPVTAADPNFFARAADGTILRPRRLPGLCQPQYIRPPYHIAKHATTTYTGRQVGQASNYPYQYSGQGAKVGIIELGGGWTATDRAYFATQGWVVIAVPVAGGSNAPGSDADVEVLLDIDVVGSVAPMATIRVYFAPNSDTGFVAAIKQARLDGCDVVSVSWGSPENQWTTQAIQNMETELLACKNAGIIVTVAAGDNGSSDGETGSHVDYPSSSQYVLGCGGTTLTAANGVWVNETVWNNGANGGATGGGVSALFPLPSYQLTANVPGGTKRGVPDIAGDADPNNGYIIQQNGQQLVVGGTSAVAPLVAGLFALLHEAMGGRPTVDIHQTLYANPGVCRDITVGNNGTFVARPDYDCCTGCGVIDGTKLLTVLTGTAPPPPPPPPPPGLTATLAASPSTVAPGHSATLTWTSNGASVAISFSEGNAGGVLLANGSPSGSLPVTPAATATYTLTATGADGKTFSAAAVVITVSAVPPPPPPTIGLPLKQVLIAVDAAFASAEKQLPQFYRPMLIAVNKYIDAAITRAYAGHTAVTFTDTSADVVWLNEQFSADHVQQAVTWPTWARVKAFIYLLARMGGPIAIPLIEAYVGTLTWLTAEQKAEINKLIESLQAAPPAV